MEWFEMTTNNKYIGMPMIERMKKNEENKKKWLQKNLFDVVCVLVSFRLLVVLSLRQSYMMQWLQTDGGNSHTISITMLSREINPALSWWCFGAKNNEEQTTTKRKRTNKTNKPTKTNKLGRIDDNYFDKILLRDSFYYFHNIIWNKTWYILHHHPKYHHQRINRYNMSNHRVC